MFFWENRHRFARFLPKISYINAVNMTATEVPRERETCQRNSIMLGLLPGALDSDVLIVADVDEIPRASTIRAALPVDTIRHLKMDCYQLYLNAYIGPWCHATVGSVGKYREASPDLVRSAGHPPINNAGWHFTYMGGAESIVEKFSAFSHQEAAVQRWNNLEQIKMRFATGGELFGEGKMNLRELDASFPEYVLKNRDRFSHMIRTSI